MEGESREGAAPIAETLTPGERAGISLMLIHLLGQLTGKPFTQMTHLDWNKVRIELGIAHVKKTTKRQTVARVAETVGMGRSTLYRTLRDSERTRKGRNVLSAAGK